MRFVLAILCLAGVGYLLTGFTEVRPGEQAVVRRFGRVVATPGPGLWVGLPWGLDRVDRVAVDRLRRVAVGYQPGTDDAPTPAGQLLTGDPNLVDVQVGVHYAVDEADVVAFVEQGGRAEELISRAAEAVLAEWVAGRGIDDVLLRGKLELPPLLVDETQRRIAPYHLGVRIRDVDVPHLFPPDEVKNAFDEVTRAQTSIRTREHEARQDAARVMREAETERYRMERRAEAYRGEQVRLARAEAERFERRLAEYRRLRARNPNVLAALWWEDMGKLLARLREGGRIDFLDNHLGPDGLDITLFPPPPARPK